MSKQYFEEYSTRLRTFTFENWPFRDITLRPSKLAQIGYYCKNQRLHCDGCQNDFIIDDMPSELILKKAFNSHDQNCPETIKRFKITPEFMHSYGMGYYEECLASWNMAIPVKKTFLQKIPADCHYLLKEDKKILAVFGWRNQDQFLVCKYCGRECEISNEEFDVFQEHRYFCKWANERTDYKYGYLIILNQLKNQSVEGRIDIVSDKERDRDTEYGTVRKTIIHQTEDIIKTSLQRSTELQNIKHSLSPLKELLAKRKRFDIKECEKERIEFEQDLQKKVKQQKDELEIKRQEQLKLLYQEEEVVQKEDKEENIEVPDNSGIEIEQQMPLENRQELNDDSKQKYQQNSQENIGIQSLLSSQENEQQQQNEQRQGDANIENQIVESPSNLQEVNINYENQDQVQEQNQDCNKKNNDNHNHNNQEVDQDIEKIDDIDQENNGPTHNVEEQIQQIQQIQEEQQEEQHYKQIEQQPLQEQEQDQIKEEPVQIPQCTEGENDNHNNQQTNNIQQSDLSEGELFQQSPQIEDQCPMNSDLIKENQEKDNLENIEIEQQQKAERVDEQQANDQEPLLKQNNVVEETGLAISNINQEPEIMQSQEQISNHNSQQDDIKQIIQKDGEEMQNNDDAGQNLDQLENNNNERFHTDKGDIEVEQNNEQIPENEEGKQQINTIINLEEILQEPEQEDNVQSDNGQEIKSASPKLSQKLSQTGVE